MPLDLGIAVSHAPGMYMRTEEQWNALWDLRSLSRGVPQPKHVYDITGDKWQEYVNRIDAGHAELTRVFDEYKPEVLIIIGGDQAEMFDRSNVPQFMIYTGEHAAGPRPSGKVGVVSDENVEMEVDVPFSEWLLEKLVLTKNFDIAFSREMQNFGRGRGLPHAFCNPASYLLQNHQPKVCLIYENTSDPPSLSAKRCYDLGVAIAELVKDDPRRIAILGSGGLGHDPGGKRSGWLDEPNDRWFLDQLANGNGRATEAMFSFESDSMNSYGTGEMRAWITVAGAMETLGTRANVLDYIPAAKVLTGLSFAYWQPAVQPVS